MANLLQPLGCREIPMRDKKMEEKTLTLRNSPAPMLGWLIAPLAIMLALAAIKVAGIDFDLELNNVTPLLIVAVGAILGITPRVLKENGAVNFSSSALSLATLGVVMIGHQAHSEFTFLIHEVGMK